MQSSAHLMQRVQGDDQDAFAGLFERYAQRAHRLAEAICHDEGHADLAVQEAFVSIWTGRATYSADRGDVGPWVMSIVRHRAIAIARTDGLHDRATAPPIELERLLDRTDVPDTAQAAEDAQRLRAMLRRLPDTQRQVIVLAFYGELTHREISDALGLPAGTVKGRMRLGLKKLRAEAER